MSSSPPHSSALAQKAEKFVDRLLFPYESHQRRHNCLFIHIPKTAGTSILSSLGKKRPSHRQHLPWYVYKAANRTYFQKAFKFAFVRNPFDRLYSAFEYLKTNGGGSRDDHILGERLRAYASFDDFICDGFHAGELRNHLLFIPQSQFILDATGELVVNHLGRYESIDADFAEISRTLGIAQQMEKKNINKNRKHADYRAAYQSTRAIEIVQDVYAQDLHAFNYRFE